MTLVDTRFSYLQNVALKAQRVPSNTSDTTSSA